MTPAPSGAQTGPPLSPSRRPFSAAVGALTLVLLATGPLPAEKVEIKLATAQDPVIAQVVGNERCTFGKSNAWIRNIALDVSGTRLAGAFHAGQAFGVLPPGTDENGKAHKVRLYSIASPEAGEDGQGNVVCTPVKRVVDEHWPPDNGAAREYMETAKHLRAGNKPTLPSTLSLEIAVNPFLRWDAPTVQKSAEARAGCPLDNPVEVYGFDPYPNTEETT